MQDTHATYFENRDSGIPLIGAVPWGSHFCQFYQDQGDLFEVLVPYLRAGLQNNELCLWVVDGPRDVEEAGQALKQAVPRFEEYARRGQVEILSRDQWRSCDGQLVPAVISRLDQAISRGFDGLRFACNALAEETHAPGARDGADALCRYNVIAVFAYPREQFDAVGLMAVVKSHRLALVKNAGRWEVIESSEAQSAKEALRRSEEKLHSVFANMSEGYSYHRIVLDPAGEPCDFVFLEINEAFERLTGLKREDLIGRRATQALPGIEKDAADWIGTCGKVALSGRPAQFESYSELLRKWYSVSAFSPHKGFFAVTFSDITGRKATEEAMQEANERLRNQTEELQAQAEELHAQTEELNAQAEELRAVNDEVQRSEQALRISEQRVRLKLDSILSPEGDLGHLELADIIDAPAIQSLMDDFYALARIPMSIIDLKGRVLVGVGWQEICTRFHRVHPQACKNCFESDTQLTAGIAPGECRLYRCKNHMWDIATPLMVAGHHMGNLFSGQFFFEDEPLDRELFRAQARGYGFNEQGYLAALEAVPRLSRAAVTTGMAFLMKLARMLSRLSYSNIELARSLEERERLMESLRRGRERLNRAQEIAHLGSWELDVARNELTWSDEVYRIFGLEPQEFGATYEAFLERVHPDDRAAVDAAYAGSLRENRDTYEIEHRVVRQGTGEIRIVHEKCEHFRDAAGRIVRSVGMVHDITERKRAEQALEQRNEFLRSVLESLTHPFYVVDAADYSIVLANAATGLPAGSSAPKCYHATHRCAAPCSDAEHPCPLEHVKRTGQPTVVEHIHYDAEGNPRNVEVHGYPLLDDQGRVTQMIEYCLDITERKQMEADLRRLNDQLEEEVQAQTEELKDTVDRLQEEVGRRTLVEETLRRRSQMLEAFFQHTITPLAFLDRHFNFVRVNAAYAQAEGREPECFVGKNHFALYPHEGNRRIFEQVLQTRQPYVAFAKPLGYPDPPHRVKYWNWLLTPLLDERGEVQFLVLNLEDVTERQQAFQELEQRARQLQKLTLELSQAEDRERKRLAEILHDDLQQQLAAAKFHLSLLGKRIGQDKPAQGAVEQLDQILKDAIEKSRSLSHELSPAVLYQSDLGETFEWLARQLKTKHGLTVHVESRGRIDPSSEALKVFLFKTAQEILFNVVKHARVREARLRIQRLRGGLWLTISDQGQGFDPRSLGKAGGFGLLSIRERIELLGGRMKIRSAEGRGCTFLITVPDGQEAEDGRQTTGDGQPRSPLSSVPHPPSSVLRVLLVDDHKVMREGLAALLSEQADLEVVGQAGNGREAVDLACRLQPDVVVMDVAMPLMAGDEATRQIKLQLPRARVLALSMFEEADMAEAMRQAGAAAYLLKTAPSDELLAAIRGRPGRPAERA